MPVNAKHPEYLHYLEFWSRCRTVVAGEDAVKKAGSLYLPMLSGMTQEDYDAYKTRAGFFGGSGRTVDAMTGMIFRKPMEVTFPESRKELLGSISKDRRSLEVFAQQLVREVVTTSRFGILVDAEVAGTDPYLVGYRAEDIINWKTRMIGGREVLSLVVLAEWSDATVQDEFEHKRISILRVLMLDADGVYRVDVWQEVKNQTGLGPKWILVDSLTPTIRGVPLNFIPFVVVGAFDLTPCVDDPVILDLVNVNLSLYRTQADLEHGRHFTALPTPWAAGFDTKGTLKLGSSAAWVTDEPNAKVGFLEFTGQGLTALENAVKQKKDEMAVLGVRMLETEKNSAEATDTHKLRRAGENSVLSSISHSCSAGLTAALTWLVDWTGASSTQPSAILNREFTDFQIDASTITALVSAYQSATLSWESLFYSLRRGHVIPEDRTSDDEKALIEAGGPAPLLPAAPML